MADAAPIWFCDKPSSAMYMIAVLVAWPGPPWVIRYDWPNMFADARMVTVVTKLKTGRSPGRVTLKNFRIAPAPSTDAASYSSLLIPCNPARRMTVLKPSVHQIVTATNEIHTQGTSTVHGTSEVLSLIH